MPLSFRRLGRLGNSKSHLSSVNNLITDSPSVQMLCCSLITQICLYAFFLFYLFFFFPFLPPYPAYALISTFISLPFSSLMGV